MEGESKMDTPKSEKEMWSPDVLFGSYPNRSGAGMTSTPYWPVYVKKLDDSAGSSKQESGYCSLTPRSADSDRLLFGKCRICHKSLHHSFTQSTPDYMCRCEKPQNDGSSSNLESMKAIQEVEMSPTPKIPTRIRPLELYEDAMDTSLYHDEMEVDHHSSGENHHCSLYFSDLDEEKSIDFMEPRGSDTPSASKETQPVCLPVSTSSDLVNLEVSQGSGKVDFQFLKVDSGDFFSPETFNCDLVSPKIKNELTPTKLKRGTPPLKMKKGSSFQSSAKKVVTIKRVLRSFPLNGVESVDFLYQLGVKNDFKIVVEKIFSFLNEEDLDSVRVVSKTWNKLLNNDVAASKRWELYNTTKRLRKENMMSPVRNGGSRGRDRLTLSTLQNVTNLTVSPPRQSFSPPVSPGSARFRSYQKAIKSLKKDERLLACPKCRFPSKDNGEPFAQCDRSGCRHRFCIWCSNEVIPERQHNCPPHIIPHCLPRKSHTIHSIGSKSSKRNLRRL